MKRLVVAMLGTLMLGGLGGCVMPGPISNRLVVEEWRSSRAERPVFNENWTYEGEYWDQFAESEGGDGEEE